MYTQAVPRYSQINMYAENGKPEKREQFLKSPAIENRISAGKGKELEEKQSMKI